MTELAERVSIQGERIEVAPGPALRRFVTRDMFFEYPGLDLTALPRHVALVPFVWAVAPIIWATDARAELESLEQTVVDSMAEVQSALRTAYPSLAWSGEVVARETAPPTRSVPRRFGEALLYSGGLDSTYSALANAGSRLLLVAAWGIDVALDDTERWQTFLDGAVPFAKRHAGGLQVVRTNARAAMDYRRLNGLTAEIGRWWMDVQFGTTLTGLAAPIAALEGIEVVHFSGGTKMEAERVYAHGSFPKLDDSISLGAAGVHHEGSDLTRQQKVNYVVASGAEAVLRVCHDKPPPEVPNCGRCLKCLRTITALVVAGADPRRYGFASYTPAVLAGLPDRFAAHEFTFIWADAMMWHDIRDNAPPDALAAVDPAFVAWLRSFDFERYGEADLRSGVRSRALVRRVRGAAPWLAPVVAPLRGIRGVRRFLP